jgi:hypothetical protein
MQMSFGATMATGMGVLFFVSAAVADSAHFPLKGLIKSGSQGGTGTTPVTVLAAATDPSTAPGMNKVLVLTQACFRVDPSNTVTLTAGSLVVPFAASNSNGGTGCQGFTPGYVVPAGTDVSCVATGTANFTCSVSGVVVRAQ